jgi:hypothetical protein
MASRPPEPTEAQSRQRWAVMQLMRIMGVALVIAGILMTQGALDLFGEHNRLVGYAFVIVGLVDGFVMPLVLARKWRTPPA